MLFVGPPFQLNTPILERSPTWYYDWFTADLASAQSLRVASLEEDFAFLSFVSFITDYTSTHEDISLLACTHSTLVYESLIDEHEFLESLEEFEELCGRSPLDGLQGSGPTPTLTGKSESRADQPSVEASELQCDTEGTRCVASAASASPNAPSVTLEPLHTRVPAVPDQPSSSAAHETTGLEPGASCSSAARQLGPDLRPAVYRKPALLRPDIERGRARGSMKRALRERAASSAASAASSQALEDAQLRFALDASLAASASDASRDESQLQLAVDASLALPRAEPAFDDAHIRAALSASLADLDAPRADTRALIVGSQPQPRVAPAPSDSQFTAAAVASLETHADESTGTFQLALERDLAAALGADAADSCPSACSSASSSKISIARLEDESAVAASIADEARRAASADRDFNKRRYAVRDALARSLPQFRGSGSGSTGTAAAHLSALKALLTRTVSDCFAVAGAFASPDYAFNANVFTSELAACASRFGIPPANVVRALSVLDLPAPVQSAASQPTSSFSSGGESGALAKASVTAPLRLPGTRSKTTSVAIEVDRSQRSTPMTSPFLVANCSGYAYSALALAQGDDLSTDHSLQALSDAVESAPFNQWHNELQVPAELIAFSAAARVRTRFTLAYKTRVYSRQELGIWRRLIHLWDSRIRGWMTAPERVVYISLANSIYQGSTTAFAKLEALRAEARYSNGRLPGCSRYVATNVASTYRLRKVTLDNGQAVWRATPATETSTTPHPLSTYRFTVTSRHHLVVRWRSVPLWSYLRAVRRARCGYGSVPKLSEDVHAAQRARYELRVAHFCQYVDAFIMFYGHPLQLNNGGLPGGFAAGAQQIGFAVAILDSDPHSHDATNYFKGASPAVTVTLGDGLDPSDRLRALATQSGLRHVMTLSTMTCVPQTTVTALQSGRALDLGLKTTSACHAMDLRDFESTGAVSFSESVMGSISSMKGFPYVIINGRHTAERTEDKHAIYHLARFKPLVDDELQAAAAYISHHSCAGRLRSVHHLGPDDVPVNLGVRDRNDPTKWSKPSWVCCDGDTHQLVGKLPDGVTRRDWCHATGNDTDHIKLLYQLRNALWPRLGSYLSAQGAMYYMANRFGLPVVAYDEASATSVGGDEQLGLWLRSLLSSSLWLRGRLMPRTQSCMLFRRAYLVMQPVNLPGVIITHISGHLLSVEIPSQTSTFRADIVSEFARVYAPLTFASQHFKFKGMVYDGACPSVVFYTEFLDDCNRADLISHPVPARHSTSEGHERRADRLYCAIQVETYRACLHRAVCGGRTLWSCDALILRDCGICVEPSAFGAFICVSPGQFKFIGTNDVFLNAECHSPRVMLNLGSATRHVVSPRTSSSSARRSAQSNAAMRHDRSVTHMLDILSQGPSEFPRQWRPATGAPVRCLQRAVSSNPKSRTRDLTTDRNYNSLHGEHNARYALARDALGILGSADDSDPRPTKPTSSKQGLQNVHWLPMRHGCYFIVTWRDRVIVQSFGGVLSFLGADVSFVSRANLQAEQARGLLQDTHGSYTMVSHRSHPASPESSTAGLQMLYRHERTLHRHKHSHLLPYHRSLAASYRPACLRLRSIPRLVHTVTAFLAALRFLTAQAAIARRRMPIYHHHSLEDALRRRADEPGHSRTFDTASWIALSIDMGRLQHGCVRAGDLYWTLHRSTMGVSARESPAYRLASAVDNWLSIPLAHLRHHPALAPHRLINCFRRMRLACARFQLLRSSLSVGQRILGRIVSSDIDGQPPSRDLCTHSVAVPGVAQRFDVRHAAHYTALPSELRSLPSVNTAPCVASLRGVRVDTSALVCGQVYHCDPLILREHFEQTGRFSHARLVRSPPAALASAHAASPVDTADIDDVAAPDVFNTSEDTAGVSETTIAVYRLLFAQPTLASERPWFDLLFDERFLAALHTHCKTVESRLRVGIYQRLKAGMLVRCRVNGSGLRSGKDPARHYQTWWFVARVVRAHSFWHLYQHFGSRFLPGRPHHYLAPPSPLSALPHPPVRITRAGRARIINAFTAWRRATLEGEVHRRNESASWTQAEVLHVAHSIYRNQHPTLASFVASESAHGVIGLVLWRMPPGFSAPTAPAVNTRNAGTSALSYQAIAHRQILASLVLQRCALAWVARIRVQRRRLAFHCYHHIARVQGLSVKVCSDGLLRDPSRTLSAVLLTHAAAIRIQLASPSRRRVLPAVELEGPDPLSSFSSGGGDGGDRITPATVIIRAVIDQLISEVEHANDGTSELATSRGDRRITDSGRSCAPEIMSAPLGDTATTNETKPSPTASKATRTGRAYLAATYAASMPLSSPVSKPVREARPLPSISESPSDNLYISLNIEVSALGRVQISLGPPNQGSSPSS